MLFYAVFLTIATRNSLLFGMIKASPAALVIRDSGDKTKKSSPVVSALIAFVSTGKLNNYLSPIQNLMLGEIVSYVIRHSDPNQEFSVALRNFGILPAVFTLSTFSFWMIDLRCRS